MASTCIYTLSLHDALPIFHGRGYRGPDFLSAEPELLSSLAPRDRKSTRLNSSHLGISYAVFCWKKKNGRDARPPVRVHGADDRAYGRRRRPVWPGHVATGR